MIRNASQDVGNNERQETGLDASEEVVHQKVGIAGTHEKSLAGCGGILVLSDVHDDAWKTTTTLKMHK